MSDIPGINDIVEKEQGVDIIENSLCVQCGGSGTTKMLLTSIPFFREIIVSSFECCDCFWSNNQVLFGGEIQSRGCKYSLKIIVKDDLNRQVIKSDYATVLFPDIDFEIPCKSQCGEITTVEGLLSTAATRLGYDQAYRMESNPEVGKVVANIIWKLMEMSSGKMLPFTVFLDDPSGNSFIENPNAPFPDPYLELQYYFRNTEQNIMLGLFKTETNEENRNTCSIQTPLISDKNFLKEENVTFQDICPSCYKSGETLMCMTDIPHFKEVIIMAFNCDECGYKCNEVKGGGPVPAYGSIFSLKVQNMQDLSRDILKSDSCAVLIPELDFELEMGTLGSMYTTVEGLLQKVKKQLCLSNPFFSGDSVTNDHRSSVAPIQAKFAAFIDKLEQLISGQFLPFTVALKDPLGNSFIGALNFENFEDDPQIKIEQYVRSFDENETLGLNDIKTEGFEVVPDGHQGDKPAEMQKLKQHRVGADHPIPFTKGIEDDTSHGVK